MSKRVNKITAVFNDSNGVTMTLYKTHEKLATLTNVDIEVKAFDESGAQNKASYMQYCREVLINLLQNGGIEGYHYDPANQSEQANTGVPRKFGNDAFVKWGRDMVSTKLGAMLDGTDIGYDVKDEGYVEPVVGERYKDGNIKYATLGVRVGLTQENIAVMVQIQAELRSGQLCKPKVMIVNGEDHNLTITAIRSLFPAKNKDAKKAPNTKATEPKNIGKLSGKMVGDDESTMDKEDDSEIASDTVTEEDRGIIPKHVVKRGRGAMIKKEKMEQRENMSILDDDPQPDPKDVVESGISKVMHMLKGDK